MAQIPTSNVSMAAINTEVSSVNSHDLKTLSTNAQSAGTGTQSQMINLSPYGMGEFKGYNHFSGVYQGAGASTWSSSQYVNTSGIILADNSATLQGYECTLNVTNINNTVSITFSSPTGTPIWTNSGWTSIKVWNNSTGTGTPVMNKNRTQFGFSVSNNGTSNALVYYNLNNQNLSTFFGFGGTSAGSPRYVEIG